MADRSPTPGPDPDDARRELDAPEPDEDTPTKSRSLFDRWWSQAASVAILGAVVIGFQWDVISTGEAIPANWVMVALGLGAIGVGAYLYRKDRPTKD